VHGKVDVDCGARIPDALQHALRKKAVFRVESYSCTKRFIRQCSSLKVLRKQRSYRLKNLQQLALDFHPRTTLTGITSAV
jgi:hypothetical protein